MYRAIGGRIRARRRRMGLTQRQLAQRLGISLSYLGHIERGTRVLSVETLVRFTQVFDCSADELLGTGKIAARSPSQLLQEALLLLEANAPTNTSSASTADAPPPCDGKTDAQR